MGVILSSFRQFLGEVWADKMLVLSLIGPILCGLLFKFGLPYVEVALCTYFGCDALTHHHVVLPYYLIADLILCMITPILIAFAGALIILDEIDNQIANYLVVTPLGKRGYLLSRIGLPALISIAYNLIVMTCFSLSNFSLMMIILLSLISSLMGMMTSLFIVALSSNRVEGLGLAKLSGLFMIGLPIALFISPPWWYVGIIFPSFWLTLFATTSSILSLIGALLSCILWIYVLYQRFIRKIL